MLYFKHMAQQLSLPGLEDENETQQSQWVSSNRRTRNQPFMIWGKPKQTGDPEELRQIVENVFETSENIRRVLPWCAFRYEVDPENGTPIIVGMPYASASEMVGASVTQSLATVLRVLATSLSFLNAQTSSFQMTSRLPDSRKAKSEETMSFDVAEAETPQ